MPKAPILLFYLPGSARDAITRMISTYLISSETSAGTGKLSIRFIDVPNQRNLRKYWVREFTIRSDYATAIYLADIRDRPSLLLNARTINWFLKQVLRKYTIIVTVIAKDDAQVEDFRRYVSDSIELVIIKENQPETVDHFVELLSGAVNKYNEIKRKNKTVSPRGN